MGTVNSSPVQCLLDQQPFSFYTSILNVKALARQSGIKSFRRLEQLPQVQQAIHNKNAEDQVWQDLASFSKDQLQLDPDLTLRVFSTYKDFVNSSIHDVDNMVSEVLRECHRRQQALENTARLLSSLAAAQQQMLDLTGRLTECSKVIQAAKAHKLSSSDHDAL
ncbi:MAG: hypothetical protein FRX49_03744 [Trebouxia sp. A1-2]|nr:MAG: hypothetical protein FRX49_03744 [Trebouxia sp. A1-2]